MDDHFDLQRFVDAQDSGDVFETARRELLAGRKQTHWMWFVFPQIAGLGHSAIAQRYAITGLDEARAYLAHPVLGPRLIECATILVELGRYDAEDVLGGIDARKLRSSMTLFACAAPGEEVFGTVLERYFSGQRDDATLARL